MNEYIKEKVKAHALRVAPEECCGFICVNPLGDITVFECENKEFNKNNRFQIDPKMNVEAERFGTIVAFYHSHASDENLNLSPHDLDASFESCIPALLYVVPQDIWKFNVPTTYEPAPLIGRPFVFGIWDCFTIVRDYCLMHKNILLGSYFEPTKEELKTSDCFDRCSVNEKFEVIPLEQIREGDVMLFRTKEFTGFHLGIYLGNNEFMHQPLKSISCVNQLERSHLKKLDKVLRIIP